jgi:hypothetical protein
MELACASAFSLASISFGMSSVTVISQYLNTPSDHHGFPELVEPGFPDRPSPAIAESSWPVDRREQTCNGPGQAFPRNRLRQGERQYGLVGARIRLNGVG